MADLIYIAVTLVFFGICVLYVRACERLIASTEEGDVTEAHSDLEEAAL